MSSMSIHNTFQSLNVSRNLMTANREMSKSMQRLSSGFRINTADDGPADLVESEKLRAQIEGLEKQIQNVTTNRNVLGVAEGALGQVQNILRDMRQYALHALNSGVTTADQVAADQAQIDAGLQAIDRIFNTASFAGTKLLDNLNKTIGSDTGGTGKLPLSTKNPMHGTTDAGPANVVATPETFLNDKLLELQKGEGTTFLRNADGTTLELTKSDPRVDENGNLVADTTFVVPGAADGSGEPQTLQFSAGTSMADVLQTLREVQIPDDKLAEWAENDEKLKAAMEKGGTLTAADAGEWGRLGMNVDEIGLDNQLLYYVQNMNDEDATGLLATYMARFGQLPEDAELTDAEKAPKKLSERDQKLLDIANSLKNLNSDSLGGITLKNGFNADGSENTLNLSLSDLYSGGAADLANDPEAALRILDKSIKDIAMQRAQIGGMQKYALDAQEENLRTQLVNLQKSESDIRDTDYATEMTKFVKTQVLSQVGMQMLGAVNHQREAILDLMA